MIEATGLILFIWLGWQQPEFGNALFTMPNSTTLTSAGLIIFAYLGFENIVSLAEETKKPEITIPRAIILSLVISTVLYVLVSFAALGLMPAKQLALSESSLVNAAMVGSKPIASIIGGIALFSTANTALICLITASRILYGISKDHSLPSLISKTHATLKTPWVAALVALFIALILLPIRSVETLANISSFATMIAFISVNIALIYLRRSEKNMARPFRIPFSIKKVPVLPLLAIFSCVVFLFQFSKSIYLTGTLVFILSAGLYFFYQLFKTKKSA